MGKFILVVPSSAREGRDAEYNAWYDSQHLNDICAIPGVKSGHRLVASDASPMPAPGNYLAIYQIETDDIHGLMAEMNRRAGEGLMPLSDALDLENAKMWIYEAR